MKDFQSFWLPSVCMYVVSLTCVSAGPHTSPPFRIESAYPSPLPSTIPRMTPLSEDPWWLNVDFQGSLDGQTLKAAVVDAERAIAAVDSVDIENGRILWNNAIEYDYFSMTVSSQPSEIDHFAAQTCGSDTTQPGNIPCTEFKWHHNFERRWMGFVFCLTGPGRACTSWKEFTLIERGVPLEMGYDGWARWKPESFLEDRMRKVNFFQFRYPWNATHCRTFQSEKKFDETFLRQTIEDIRGAYNLRAFISDDQDLSALQARDASPLAVIAAIRAQPKEFLAILEAPWVTIDSDSGAARFNICVPKVDRALWTIHFVYVKGDISYYVQNGIRPIGARIQADYNLKKLSWAGWRNSPQIKNQNTTSSSLTPRVFPNRKRLIAGVDVSLFFSITWNRITHVALAAGHFVKKLFDDSSPIVYDQRGGDMWLRTQLSQLCNRWQHNFCVAPCLATTSQNPQEVECRGFRFDNQNDTSMHPVHLLACSSEISRNCDKPDDFVLSGGGNPGLTPFHWFKFGKHHSGYFMSRIASATGTIFELQYIHNGGDAAYYRELLQDVGTYTKVRYILRFIGTKTGGGTVPWWQVIDHCREMDPVEEQCMVVDAPYEYGATSVKWKIDRVLNPGWYLLYPIYLADEVDGTELKDDEGYWKREHLTSQRLRVAKPLHLLIPAKTNDLESLGTIHSVDVYSPVSEAERLIQGYFYLKIEGQNLHRSTWAALLTSNSVELVRQPCEVYNAIRGNITTLTCGLFGVNMKLRVYPGVAVVPYERRSVTFVSTNSEGSRFPDFLVNRQMLTERKWIHPSTQGRRRIEQLLPTGDTLEDAQASVADIGGWYRRSGCQLDDERYMNHHGVLHEVIKSGDHTAFILFPDPPEATQREDGRVAIIRTAPVELKWDRRYLCWDIFISIDPPSAIRNNGNYINTDIVSRESIAFVRPLFWIESYVPQITEFSVASPFNPSPPGIPHTITAYGAFSESNIQIGLIGSSSLVASVLSVSGGVLTYKDSDSQFNDIRSSVNLESIGTARCASHSNGETRYSECNNIIPTRRGTYCPLICDRTLSSCEIHSSDHKHTTYTTSDSIEEMPSFELPDIYPRGVARAALVRDTVVPQFGQSTVVPFPPGVTLEQARKAVEDGQREAGWKVRHACVPPIAGGREDTELIANFFSFAKSGAGRAAPIISDTPPFVMENEYGEVEMHISLPALSSYIDMRCYGIMTTLDASTELKRVNALSTSLLDLSNAIEGENIYFYSHFILRGVPIIRSYQVSEDKITIQGYRFHVSHEIAVFGVWANAFVERVDTFGEITWSDFESSTVATTGSPGARRRLQSPYVGEYQFAKCTVTGHDGIDYETIECSQVDTTYLGGIGIALCDLKSLESGTDSCLTDWRNYRITVLGTQAHRLVLPPRFPTIDAKAQRISATEQILTVRFNPDISLEIARRTLIDAEQTEGDKTRYICLPGSHSSTPFSMLTDLQADRSIGVYVFEEASVYREEEHILARLLAPTFDDDYEEESVIECFPFITRVDLISLLDSTSFPPRLDASTLTSQTTIFYGESFRLYQPPLISAIRRQFNPVAIDTGFTLQIEGKRLSEYMQLGLFGASLRQHVISIDEIGRVQKAASFVYSLIGGEILTKPESEFVAKNCATLERNATNRRILRLQCGPFQQSYVGYAGALVCQSELASCADSAGFNIAPYELPLSALTPFLAAAYPISSVTKYLPSWGGKPIGPEVVSVGLPMAMLSDFAQPSLMDDLRPDGMMLRNICLAVGHGKTPTDVLPYVQANSSSGMFIAAPVKALQQGCCRSVAEVTFPFMPDPIKLDCFPMLLDVDDPSSLIVMDGNIPRLNAANIDPSAAPVFSPFRVDFAWRLDNVTIADDGIEDALYMIASGRRLPRYDAVLTLTSPLVGPDGDLTHIAHTPNLPWRISRDPIGTDLSAECQALESDPDTGELISMKCGPIVNITVTTPRMESREVDEVVVDRGRAKNLKSYHFISGGMIMAAVGVLLVCAALTAFVSTSPSASPFFTAHSVPHEGRLSHKRDEGSVMVKRLQEMRKARLEAPASFVAFEDGSHQAGIKSKRRGAAAAFTSTVRSAAGLLSSQLQLYGERGLLVGRSHSMRSFVSEGDFTLKEDDTRPPKYCPSVDDSHSMLQEAKSSFVAPEKLCPSFLRQEAPTRSLSPSRSVSSIKGNIDELCLEEDASPEAIQLRVVEDNTAAATQQMNSRGSTTLSHSKVLCMPSFRERYQKEAPHRGLLLEPRVLRKQHMLLRPFTESSQSPHSARCLIAATHIALAAIYLTSLHTAIDIRHDGEYLSEALFNLGSLNTADWIFTRWGLLFGGSAVLVGMVAKIFGLFFVKEYASSTGQETRYRPSAKNAKMRTVGYIITFVVCIVAIIFGSIYSLHIAGDLQRDVDLAVSFSLYLVLVWCVIPLSSMIISSAIVRTSRRYGLFDWLIMINPSFVVFTSCTARSVKEKLEQDDAFLPAWVGVPREQDLNNPNG